MKFSGKIAVITGAAQGIGLSVAQKLAAEGLSIVITDINLDEAEKQVKDIAKVYGVQSFAKKMDVSCADEVKGTLEQIRKEVGNVDILVNNAGICYPKTDLKEISEEQWLKVFTINVLGIVNCTNAVVDGMKKNKFGRIVNMSSSSGFTGGISVSATYAVSKAGVMALTKNMAKQFGSYGITVNALSPGVIKSAMTENLVYDMSTIALGRFGETSEVADLVAFLASDESSYLTGTTIDINGGLYMR